MKTKQAILKILKGTGKSKYWLAKQIGVKSIMIDNYIRTVKPCKMGIATAKRFTSIFSIDIDDIYNPIKAIDDDTETVPSGE